MSEGAERLRLFVAVEIPRPVLERVDAVVAPHRADVRHARWAPLDNQHVTLKFLGSVDAERKGDVAAACERAASHSKRGTIRVSGFGAFPTTRRARVLWAGLEDAEGVLALSADSLHEELQGLGFEPEKRAFTAHLTLARLKVPSDVGTFLEQLAYHSDEIAFDRFHLYRSRLSPKGARYEVLDTFVLPS